MAPVRLLQRLMARRHLVDRRSLDIAGGAAIPSPGDEGGERTQAGGEPRADTPLLNPFSLHGPRKTTGIMADIRGPRRAPGSGRAIANCQVLHEPKNANLMAFDVDFDG